MKRLICWKDVLSKEKMMYLDMSLLKTCESWNTKGNYQQWHNTTSKDKVERIALRNARWRMLELLKTKHVLSTMFIFEYSLADLNFEKNLEEQFENERKPWRTTMLSLHEELWIGKYNIKNWRFKANKVEALQWLDGVSQWHNRENLALWKERWTNEIKNFDKPPE